MRVWITALLLAVATQVSARQDSVPAAFQHRVFLNLNHIVAFWQPSLIAGYETRITGRHHALLEGAYWYSTFQPAGSEMYGYRLRLAYRYYLPSAYATPAKTYFTFMAALQQRIQTNQSWYCRYDCLYREFLTTRRTWNAQRFHVGGGCIFFKNSPWHLDAMGAIGVRWYQVSAYQIPDDALPRRSNLFEVGPGRYFLPDFVVHLSVGRTF